MTPDEAVKEQANLFNVGSNDFHRNIIAEEQAHFHGGLVTPQDPDTHIAEVEEIWTVLGPFHRGREATYQMSFARRGMSGIFHNLVRKTDRLDKVFQGYAFLQNGSTELMIDTLVDIAMYALKWVAMIRRHDPVAWQNWIDSHSEDIFGAS